MGKKYLVVERARSGCGRNGDETWVNVGVRTAYVGGNREPQINREFTDPNGTHFLVEITDEQFFSMAGSRGLFADPETRQVPLIQQRVAGDRPTAELGHFADGRDPGSEWRAGTPRART